MKIFMLQLILSLSINPIFAEKSQTSPNNPDKPKLQKMCFIKDGAGVCCLS